MCHAMLPVLIISDTEALALNVQPGLVDAQLDWSAAAHPDAADYALYARWPSGATWELLDTVPLTQTARAHTELSSGQYAYFVAARDATGDILARSDEIAVNVGVTSLNPDYGLNNVPAVVYIHGSGFQTPLTVTVGITQLSDVFVVDAHTIQAVIPAGLAPGRYDVSVHTSAGQAVAHSAYQAVDAGVGDDLQSFPEWLWTDPRAARVKPTGNRIGLNVQHWQGKNNVGRVLVEFRLGGPQGAILGQARTNFLPPGSIESTDPLTWTPQSAGDYYVCAIIDPYNDVSESDETNNVICRTIPVQPPALDTIPPVVEDIEIEHGASTTSQQAVTMDVPATDYPIPGASGMQACMFGEFEYILGAQRWVAIQWSDWVDYETAHSDYPWSLMPVFGMRYIQAWCADNAGNISLQPGVDVINLIPETQTGHVAQNGVVFYRIYLEQNQALTAHLTPLDGDPDLYVWGPDDGLWYSNNGAGSDDAVAFNAPFGGVYQVEVHGFSDARYQLTFATRQTQRHSRSLAATTKPLPTAPVVPLDEWPLYFDIDIDPLPPSLVEMSSGYDQDAEPGDVVTYTHTVMNTKATTDTLTLDVASSENWDVYLLGGDYPSGTLQLPLRLGSYMTATVVVSLTVPADAISGTVDHTVVTATSGISPTVFVTATDSTTVKVGMHLVFLPLVIKNQ